MKLAIMAALGYYDPVNMAKRIPKTFQTPPTNPLSNQNVVDYPTVQPDECPDRTARPGRPSPDGPATARLYLP